VPRAVRQLALQPVGRLWPDAAPGVEARHFLAGIGGDPLTQYGRQMELFSPAEKRTVLGEDWAAELRGYDHYWHLRRYWREDVDPITRVQYVDFKTYLPDDILTKVDRATMAVGLEARPPFLDHKLVELAFAIPAPIRFRQAEKKYLLKRAVADRLPPEIINRGKKGFSSPLMQWMQQGSAWTQRFLGDRPTIVRNGAERGLERRNLGPKHWALLVLEQWARDERAG
jgi:asparagine synthase (glutamine-hydrolysing)